MHKTVYRIEHKDTGVGPYQGTWDWGWDHGGPLRPSPDELQWNYDFCHQFGFSSLKQLYRWFTKEMRIELDRMGFRIIKLEAQIILEHPTQVLFRTPMSDGDSNA